MGHDARDCGRVEQMDRPGGPGHDDPNPTGPWFVRGDLDGDGVRAAGQVRSTLQQVVQTWGVGLALPPQRLGTDRCPGVDRAEP